MSNTWKRVARAGGEGWIQIGVDWGNGHKPIVLWHKTKEHVVFKVPAGKHWASLLEPSVSHPGSYVVCKLIEDRDGVLITEQLFEMPVSERGRGKL